jgi:hypothetical protein
MFHHVYFLQVLVEHRVVKGVLKVVLKVVVKVVLKVVVKVVVLKVVVKDHHQWEAPPRYDYMDLYILYRHR